MINLTGITKVYGSTRALDNVSMSIAPGEVIALAGENGSGKSTLMKVLSGVVVPDEGTIELNGERVSFSRPRDALERGIALVSQELTIVPPMSVYENIGLSIIRDRGLKPVNRREMIRIAEQALGRLGIDYIDPRRTVDRLGPVDQTLVEIAKALVAEPQVLILDEATSRLGAHETEELLALVHRLREEGLSTVMITHRIAEMTATADRAVVLRDGILAGGLEKEELEEANLVRLMVGRDIPPRIREHADASTATPVFTAKDVVVAGTEPKVSLDVRPGEIVGIAGLVGAGRSELLESLYGLRKREGEVEVAGKKVPHMRVKKARRRGLSLVPEDRRKQGLLVRESITENYALGGTDWYQLFRRGKAKAAARSAVQTFGVKTRDVGSGVSTLSGGNQQKVVIARALSNSPKVLLLDEPTRGVDIGAREEIYKIIVDKAQAGMGVLLASSDMNELLTVADRVLVMHEHAIVGELVGDQVTEDNIALLSAGGRMNFGQD